MYNSYKNYFGEAISRTAAFKMGLPNEDLVNLGKDTNRYSTHENQMGVGQHIYKSLGGFTAKDITAQCLKYSILSKPLIDEYLGIKTILTIGYVVDGGKERFKFGDIDIVNMMNKSPEKYSSKAANVHAWLTLPSFEIFDLTFRESKNDIANYPFNAERGFDFIFNSLDSLHSKQQLVYVPMLVGNDCLFKLNLAAPEVNTIAH